MKPLSLCLAAGLALATLSGCALTKDARGAVPFDEEPAQNAAAPIEKTDFSPDTWVYRHPNRSPLEYAKIIIAPVRIYENMSSEVKKRDRRYLNEVGTSFGKRIQRLIEKDYMPVASPDELTLRIEIELFELKPSNRIFKDLRQRLKLGDDVAGTKLEGSCYDSVSGELIFAVSTFYTGEEYAAYRNPVLIKNLRGAFGEWSEHFKKRFDEEMSLF